jgi:hypothetical protein
MMPRKATTMGSMTTFDGLLPRKLLRREAVSHTLSGRMRNTLNQPRIRGFSGLLDTAPSDA